MSARGIPICGTGDQPEPSRDDSPHRVPRFRIVGERRIVHALLDFKPPNRNFRGFRNRFIDIGCHALVAYYLLWQRWQDKAVYPRDKPIQSSYLPDRRLSV
jgi:hypothetical protein